MKIFAVGRNYKEHAKELKNRVPDQPIIFIKPKSALLINNMPFDLPSFSDQVDHEVEIVLQLSRNGKNIDKSKAADYIKGIGIGLDFTARDIQKKCKENGLPWEIAKGFDHSAAISPILEPDKFEDINNIGFSLKKNGETVQEGNTSDMVFPYSELISYISKYFTINIGDLIYTGTPAGVGQIVSGDLLEAFIGDEMLLHCEVK